MTWLLPRVVGLGRATETAQLARWFTAETALRWGPASETTDTGKALARAIETAQEITTPYSIVGASRQLLQASYSRDLVGRLDAEATAQGVARLGPDFHEVREAFREGRRLHFTPKSHGQTRKQRATGSTS